MKKVADFRMQNEFLEGFEMEGMTAPEEPESWNLEDNSKALRPSAERKRFLEEVIYERAVEEAMIQGGMVSLEIDDEELHGILTFEGAELMRVHQDTRMDELVQHLLTENTRSIWNFIFD